MGKVIKGYHEGKKIKSTASTTGRIIYIQPETFGDYVIFNKDTLINYEVVTEDTVKSGSSAILRGAVGAALLPGIGILAGLSAKNKSTYLVAVEWKNGEKSLLELNQHKYETLVASMF